MNSDNNVRAYSRHLLGVTITANQVPLVLKKIFLLEMVKNGICLGGASKQNALFPKKCALPSLSRIGPECSMSHALINITENIRKALDDKNIGFGVFVDVQKAFDNVDYQILLAKLNDYGIHGISIDWFKSYVQS